jgi:hypothetical protein
MENRGCLIFGVILLIGLLLLAGVLAYRTWGQPAEEEDEPSLIERLVPAPTPTIYPSSNTVIRSVERLSRLETTSYYIEKVITAESGQGPLGFLFGDRLLLVAAGEVIAGVDLGQIGAEDVTVSGGTLYMRLPPPEIFVATLDNENTYVYDRRTGVIGMNPELETAARREAERLVREAALEDGIIEEAAQNAERFLVSFLLALGFEEVIFTETIPTPTPQPTVTPTPTTPSTF